MDLPDEFKNDEGLHGWPWARSWCDVFLIIPASTPNILVRFDPFLTSWGPGTRLKSFLDAIRFDSTVYEPVATLETSNCLIFYGFQPPFRPANSSILAFSVEKRFFDKEVTPLDPSHKIRIKILHKMTCLPAPHHFSWTRS